MALPKTSSGPPSCSLSRVTSCARAPLTTVELFHSSGSAMVDETTYFGIEFILSANSPSRCGHDAAKPS